MRNCARNTALPGKRDEKIQKTSAPVIGVTGGIGSGKSRVCNYLAELCQFPVIDLDSICKQLLVRDAPGWLALQKILADNFFTDSGELDRRALREAIFADAMLRQQVDFLLHPLAHREMTAQISKLNCPVLVEIPPAF